MSFDIRKSLGEYSKSESGSFVAFFAIALTLMLSATGFAVDYARAYNTKDDLKALLDAAVLAGVTEGEGEASQRQIASSVFNANKSSVAAGAFDVTQVRFWNENDELHGEASARMTTTFLRFFNSENLQVSNRSAATSGATRKAACFMAMHPTRKHTLEMKDAVDVMAPDCHIYGNSDHPYDVVDPHTPQNHMVTASLQAIGYGHHYLQNLTPPLEYAPEYIPDPLADLVIPDGTGCSSSNNSSKKKGKKKKGKKAKKGKKGKGGGSGGSSTTISLNPGTYCSGFEYSNSTITLAPGTYIIKDGDFSLDNSTLTGDGVTLVLADDDVEISWEDSLVQISAPTSGTYESLAIIGVREETEHEIDGAVADIHGVVYLPNGAFEWTNSGNSTMAADWTAWIVDGVTWRGTGTIYYNFKPKDSDVPYPDELFVIPRPGSARLIM